MNDKYVKLADVKRKLRYILKAYGTSDFVRDKIKSALNDLPYSVKSDLETTLEVSDVQPVDRWISVDERLPKTGESVLVYVAINKNLKGFGECKPEIRIGWLDDGGKWALQFSNMNYTEVLCWIPLPEPPKDGDTNA